MHDLQSGKQFYQIPLDIGTVDPEDGVWARKSGSEFFIVFSSFLVPGIVYHGNFGKVPTKNSKVKLREIRGSKVQGLDTVKFVVKQVKPGLSHAVTYHNVSLLK